MLVDGLLCVHRNNAVLEVHFMHCRALFYCIAQYYTAMQSKEAVKSAALRCNKLAALHTSALHCTVKYRTGLHSTALLCKDFNSVQILQCALKKLQ